MIDKCPECNQDVSILLRNGTTYTTSSTFSFTVNTGYSLDPNIEKYKCNNPKCWVSKITKTWE